MRVVIEKEPLCFISLSFLSIDYFTEIKGGIDRYSNSRFQNIVSPFFALPHRTYQI
jgi:hypothetical protein